MKEKNNIMFCIVHCLILSLKVKKLNNYQKFIKF